MPSAIETTKEERVGAAEALTEALADAAERDLLRRFVAELYAHVPPVDFAARGAADLFGAALSLWRFAEIRQRATAKVRVYNPDPATDGWWSPRTIVEIVNDDMPFLVDSVTGAINESGREVRLVIHPILGVVRDGAGRAVALAPDAPGSRESWMQIEITREPDPAELTRLKGKLEAVLVQVRAAVGDWQPMRETLRAIAGDLREDPPPLPPAELEESVEFLDWLDDNNFTY